ncbi:hypothetical protein O6H91_07G048700 [Diphasiastrum complanatum]|uniref:Uncharacterized protein n=1 Tax=Diphasiastrum complanatum TaxID=34168 RepID=A0ACC2D573_DIPCM|nr:hypothetical protein O6H91_07G048700 [Diphasiastrum complanatum]
MQVPSQRLSLLGERWFRPCLFSPSFMSVHVEPPHHHHHHHHYHGKQHKFSQMWATTHTGGRLLARHLAFRRHIAATASTFGNSWISEAAQSASIISSERPLQVVLVSPQIPGNTGSIARTCAATLIKLHLVEPLGFEIDDSKLKRAGLDYWPYVVVKVHQSWTQFYEFFEQQEGEKRLIAFTKRGACSHTGISYRPGDWLLFGSETKGLPTEALDECSIGKYAGGTARIPMCDSYVRSLNLAVSVGIGLYEALRQLKLQDDLNLDASPSADIHSPDDQFIGFP